MVLLLKCILVHATPKFRFYTSLRVLIVLKDTKDHVCFEMAVWLSFESFKATG